MISNLRQALLQINIQSLSKEDSLLQQ